MRLANTVRDSVGGSAQQPERIRMELEDREGVCAEALEDTSAQLQCWIPPPR